MSSAKIFIHTGFFKDDIDLWIAILSDCLGTRNYLCLALILPIHTHSNPTTLDCFAIRVLQTAYRLLTNTSPRVNSSFNFATTLV